MFAGRLLRWARLHTGTSQQSLSAKTGIAQSTISRIETGEFEPHVRTLRLLLRACGYDLELAPVRGFGVDRSELRQQLSRTPTERAEAAAAFANAARSWQGIARRPGRPPTRPSPTDTESAPDADE
jgi:transcriptional regulator with XRE-family HTH domain